MNWNSTLKIKHLLTEKEDLKSVQKIMNAIADVIDKDGLWISLIHRFLGKSPKEMNSLNRWIMQKK